MKRLSILIIILTLALASVQAQEKGTYTVGFETQASLYGGSSELKSVDLGFDLGYNVTDWLTTSLRFKQSVGLFNIDKVKSYQTSGVWGVLGGVLGFNVYRSDVGTLTLKASVGATVGKNDWKYTYYSGGAYFNMTKQKIKPTIGFGVKYFDSQADAFDDYLRVFVSLGVRLN